MSPNGPPPADAERSGPDRPPKRRRIALACTYCRNRKSKCDGGRPSCSFCSGLGLQCSYEHRVKSQKKSGGEYDHRLKLIEETLQQLVQTRDDRSDGPSQATHFGATSHDDPFVLGVDNAQDSANDETRVDGLATVNGSDTDSRYFGPSSNIAFLKLVSSTTSAVLKSTVAQRWQRQRDSQQSHGDLSDGRNNVHETLTRLTSPVPAASSSSCTPSSPVSKTPTILPAKALVLHLLDLYFSNTGIFFPFISERRVYASYHALNTKCSSGSRKSLLCLLNAIFAFATLMNAKNGYPDSKNAAEADVFYHRALALIPRSYEGSSDIETVQYLILLSQYCQNTQRPEDTWFLHGLAVQAATRIGLASTSRMNAFSGVEREVRKRLWFGCFILDRTLSMTLGRPPIIQDILGNMELPLDTTLGQLDVDTSGPSGHHERPHSALFFIATIQLYKILGSIISKLYGYNLDEEQCMFRLETSKDILLIENDLDSWKRSLPSSMLNRPWESCLSDTSPSHDAVSARLSTVTHLRYLNVRILLHRPALQHLLKQRSLLRPVIDQNQPVFDAITNASAAICRDCATQIIGIVCQLSKTMDLLGARWFSIYYTFNAALVSFSCLLLEPSRGDLVSSLKMAVEATERLDTDTQASRRVLKILHRLIDMSESLRELSLLNKDMPDLDSGLSAAALTTFLHDSSTEPCDELGLAAKTQPTGKTTSHVLDTIGQTFPGWHNGDMGILWPLDGTGDDFLGTLQF